MIRCRLVSNDTAVESQLAEEVLELEYLEKSVLTDNDRWLGRRL